MTASDLRAARARQRIPMYKLGAIVSVHPGRLALMLNERIPLTEVVAKRVAAALENMQGPKGLRLR
ncbi:MAG: hypothetical protein Q7W02_02490 [Candidatus Rokubacteria bacterium]|nr:hypothetical protein [Candidatus Rokubacteria bacterium]